MGIRSKTNFGDWVVKFALGVFGVLFITTLIAGGVMANTKASADEPLPTDTKSATASVNVTAACTLSGGNNTYSKTLTPGGSIEINPISTGTTPEGNAIKAVCNDPGGFGLYAIGYSGDSYTASTHTDLIASNSGTTNNIHTATSGGSSNNSYWAMKLTGISGTYTPTIENSYSSYQVVPANFTKVASLNKATDLDNTSTNPTTAAEGSSVYATYKVGSSSSQVADTYTGKVKYVLVHPGSMVAGTYTIAFNANGGTGSMASQTAYNFEETTLNAMSGITAPDGYKFAGWCDVQDQTASGVVSGADPQTTCTGTSYADEGTVLPGVAAVNSTYNLYAMWEEIIPIVLYDAVAAAWETEGSRVQTNNTDADTGIQAAITATNSGVFKYNSSVFGADSDVTKSDGTKADIYYYRGILDTTTGSYGSDGDNAAHPNTVLLDANSNGKDTTDTCWRIVRTTGSGGVKMVYQGKWTGSTCANAGTAARVANRTFNDGYKQIVSVGYTYNSTYATNNYKVDTVAKVFGSSSVPSYNNTRSNIKAYIEDTWYANNMTAYTSILEPSAGYCNDRTLNTSESWTSAMKESDKLVTYNTSSVQTYYFGAYPRNMSTTQPPSLNCGRKYSQIDRNTVDLYHYNGINGAAGGTTVNYLKYPAALLTADEASFAGSGSRTASQGSAYHAKSYLRSGSDFWLLSPHSRLSGNYTCNFYLGSEGYLRGNDYIYVNDSLGVRPSISLTSGTAALSGSGTATDPWVVMAP